MEKSSWTKRTPEKCTSTAYSWTASIVSVPADPTVGVGREMEEKSEPGTQDIPLDIYERQLQINKNRMEVKENDD